jgi:hypothetical protein
MLLLQITILLKFFLFGPSPPPHAAEQRTRRDANGRAFSSVSPDGPKLLRRRLRGTVHPAGRRLWEAAHQEFADSPD